MLQYTEIRCPSCGSTDNTEPANENIYTVHPSQTEFVQYVCKNCGKIFLHHKQVQNMSSPGNVDHLLGLASKSAYIQQGWECPKCGSIIAPHMDYCPICSLRNNTPLQWTCGSPSAGAPLDGYQSSSVCHRDGAEINE